MCAASRNPQDQYYTSYKKSWILMLQIETIARLYPHNKKPLQVSDAFQNVSTTTTTTIMTM